MRVHELAKELQTDTKTLTVVLAGIDIAIKTHFAVLTDEQADKVREIYASGSAPKPPVSKKPPRKRAPKSAKKEVLNYCRICEVFWRVCETFIKYNGHKNYNKLVN